MITICNPRGTIQHDGLSSIMVGSSRFCTNVVYHDCGQINGDNRVLHLSLSFLVPHVPHICSSTLLHLLFVCEYRIICVGLCLFFLWKMMRLFMLPRFSTYSVSGHSSICLTRYMCAFFLIILYICAFIRLLKSYY